jgi:hypothetical protein
MKIFSILLSALLLFSSCEKNIDFNLKNADDLVVVDAQIENGKIPTVILTRSFDFFSSISPQILAGSFIRNAEVSMSNGTLMHKLKEYAVSLAPGYTAYYYSIDSSSLATAFLGEFNKQYTLTIKAEGKEYSAITHIPVLAKYPDSIWFKRAPLNPDTNKRVIMTRTTDPPGLGNYIRYFTRRNSGNFLPGANSVFDDAVIDGTSYEFQVDQGIDRNNPLSADSNFFKKGDTLTFKLCNIDKATFTFWNTWEFAQQSVGNPFAQPNKVIGNISNGALGAFYGYAAWYKTIIAQ